jgi:hypothetical protein
LDFWFEKKPSGNPDVEATEPHRQGCTWLLYRMLPKMSEAAVFLISFHSGVMKSVFRTERHQENPPNGTSRENDKKVATEQGDRIGRIFPYSENC